MPYTGPDHRRIEADKRVSLPASLYFGGLLLATSGGAATVAVYAGLDTSGDLIDYFSAAASARDRNYLPIGIPLRHGLYVDVSSNVSSFVVFFSFTPQEVA